jgi:hypothetical protein|tara:strand:- start:6800 stop:7588 length:789 start_codon:yes stop_codon:yes gene_type:complete
MTKERILAQSLAIRTFPTFEVQDIVSKFHLTTHDEVAKFKSNITEWLCPTVDLSSFSHLYFTNGITEGMNYWMWQETRAIKMANDDYQWVSGTASGDVLYLSNPASYDGNFVDIPTDIPVVLDLAYIGSSTPRKIEIPDNVERVFFSLSKTFGLRNYRIGYCWTRVPDRRLSLLQDSAKYYNYHSVGLGEAIIDRFDVDTVYNKLLKYQIQVCDELRLTASDVLWLATSPDPAYQKFFRNHTNRLCIADLIKEKYYADTNCL